MLVFEISNNWVKALWGRSVLKDTQIAAFVARPLESDSQEELFKVISSIVDIKTFKKYKPLVLCIPRNLASLRNLKFPSVDDKELDNIVKLHLAQQVPYSREEIIYNYAIIEKAPSGFTKIFLEIVHKELLRKQFFLFERLNLYPENVQLSTFGLMEFLRKAKIVKSDDKELKACLDIDTNFSDFLIFRGEKVLFSKSLATGALKLEQPDRLTRFMGEIKQAIVVFKVEETTEILSRLYVSGSTIAQAVGLAENIGRELQLSVEVIDPLEVVSSLKNIKGIKNLLKKVSVSALLGIARNPLSPRLNFVLPEAKLKRDMRKMGKNLIATGSIVVYLVVLMLLGLMGKIYNRQMYLNKLTGETSALKASNAETIVALEKIKRVKDFTREKDSFLYYYYELAKIVPRNITIDRLIFAKKKEFSLLGKGTDMGEIFKFVTVLTDAKIFGKIELRYSRKKTRDKSEYNEFEVMCHLKETAD